MRKFAEIISTLFYCGRSPIAPGTVGTISSLIIISPLAFTPSILWCAFMTATSIILGFIFIPLYLNGKVDDLQEIVIDEMAGLYLTILTSMIAVKFFQIEVNWFIIFISSFILFRFFDITKVSLIGHLDRNMKGATGIMLDDIMAGIFAGGTITFCIFIYKLIQ